MTERIIKAFEVEDVQYDGPQDETYSLEHYDALCKDVIYCRLPSLRWPTYGVCKKEPTPASGEYLQGTEAIKRRYEHVSLALNAVSDKVFDNRLKEAC